MANIYLGLGSNKGDRAANLKAALKMLPPLVSVKKVSSLYESAPMYMENQDPFYNIAVHGHTQLTPFDLFQLVKEVERQVGRTPSETNGPREIDIDILLFDDLILNTPELQIPHPRMHERAFVIVPLEEIARMAYHPALDTHVVDLWDRHRGGGGLVWEADEAFIV
jgi:2-amino-4-hydroxy-6-hydroxymethyldihydropteridine diphosphokinase